MNFSGRYRHWTLGVDDDHVTLSRGGPTFLAILNVITVFIGRRSTDDEPHCGVMLIMSLHPKAHVEPALEIGIISSTPDSGASFIGICLEINNGSCCLSSLH